MAAADTDVCLANFYLTAYCAWLRKTTGQPFRLGKSKEMEDVYDAAESAGNTLDFWAGYALNPEDRRKLQEQIRELNGQAPLLKDSFKMFAREMRDDDDQRVGAFAEARPERTTAGDAARQRIVEHFVGLHACEEAVARRREP